MRLPPPTDFHAAVYYKLLSRRTHAPHRSQGTHGHGFLDVSGVICPIPFTCSLERAPCIPPYAGAKTCCNYDWTVGYTSPTRPSLTIWTASSDPSLQLVHSSISRSTV